MIGLYVRRSFSLRIGCLENVQINNQTILHFFDFWSKALPVNISYPMFFNPIDGCLDASIGPSYVIYIVTTKTNAVPNKIRERSLRGDFHNLSKEH